MKCRIDDVRKAFILGFVFVSAVNKEKNTVQLLLPSGGDLPGTIMLKGDIEWNSSFDYQQRCVVCCSSC